MITTIIILSVLLLTSIFVNINQLRKQEALSDYIEELENSNTEYYNFYQIQMICNNTEHIFS